MPGLISIISALALLLAGAWLLHDGVSGRDLLQIEIIAGATLLSVGVVCSVLLLRHRIKWKRELGNTERDRSLNTLDAVKKRVMEARQYL